MKRHSMQRRDLVMREGGLYRCCLITATHWVQEAPDRPVTNGETITCSHCNSDGRPTQMVVVGAELRWLDPDYPPIVPGVPA